MQNPFKKLKGENRKFPMIAKKKFGYLLAGLMGTVIFALSYHLFYNFITNVYDSDFPAHIYTVLKGNPMYSLMHRLIEGCYWLPHSETMLAILMSLLILGTAFGMYMYLKMRVGSTYPMCILAVISFALLFTSNLYIPEIFPHFYNHYTKVSQPWHNSTYILMRFFSVFVILLYFKIFDQIKNNRFGIKDVISFCIILSLCNFSKPNFFLAFAPTAFLAFVFLFVKSKGKKIKELFIWGCSFLMSMPCMFYMVGVVYDESENQLAFSSENFVDYLFGNEGGGFFICEISNLIFPLFVLGVFGVVKVRKEYIETDRLLQGFLIFFIGHLEQLLMIEDGPSKESWNYAWGVYCVGMILFLICVGEWLRAYDQGYLKSKMIFVTGVCLFAAQTICGIKYFAILLQGLGYVL